MEEQKFKPYDLVQVTDKLPESMSRFTGGCRAIVKGSYADQFGGENTNSYSLYLEGRGECSWYYEDQLTLIKTNAYDLLQEWKREKKALGVVQSDLKWIIENWPKLRKEGVPGPAIVTLMNEIGITNPWGSHGEGIDYHTHAMFTCKAFDEVLQTGDLDKVKLFILEFPKINGSFSNTNFHKDGF